MDADDVRLAHNFFGDEPFELSDEEWWALRPDDLVLYNRAKRRWRLQAARRKGTHTTEIWAWIVAACGHRCVMCGSEGVTKDHILAVFCGGSDGPENLQPLCKNCNSGKQDSLDYRPAHVRWCLGLVL